jgi:hypothetical protein
MTTSLHRGTAEILQFPARVRPPPGAHPSVHGEAARPGENQAGSFAKTVFGSAWYHDDAIEDERTGKN